MEDWEKEYQNTLIIWFSILFSTFIYFFILGLMKPYPLNSEIYKTLFIEQKMLFPPIVKILYFLGISQFFIVIFAKNISIQVFKKNPRVKIIVMSAFAESIAIYGFVAGFITESIFFVPLGVLSIIGVLLWMPKKSDFQSENTKNLPYSFE